MYQSKLTNIIIKIISNITKTLSLDEVLLLLLYLLSYHLLLALLSFQVFYQAKRTQQTIMV